MQFPFYPRNSSYSTATFADVCGVSGLSPDGGCNLFQPGVQTGVHPQFILYPEGEGAYSTDKNNWAPSVGFAWTLGGKGGLLRSVLGNEEGDSVVRAGYSVAFNRPGMSDFTGAIDDNPGISLTTNRTHTLGNLGTPGEVLLRSPGTLGPPSFPLSRNYPLTDTIDGDVRIFDPNLQVPYAQSWTAGWQRKLTQNMAFEARYVGTRALQEWVEFNYNEVNIVENGFLDEFRLAQGNLRANLAAGRGANFRYAGPNTGTSPLPIFLAYFSGLSQSAASNSANYSSRAVREQHVREPAGDVQPAADHGSQRAGCRSGTPSERAERRPAGELHRGQPGSAWWRAKSPPTAPAAATTPCSWNCGSACRMASSSRPTTPTARSICSSASRSAGRTRKRRDVGDEGGVAHAFKTNWVYELPFGQNRRFFSGVNTLVDRIIGGWEFDGIATIQSGRQVSFGNVRLVGMSEGELRDNFKLRFDDAGRVVYMLPQDIIDNTIAAFDVSATSLTGYGSRGAPTGRYMAPANGPDCIELAQTAVTTGYGDCGGGELVMTGPSLVRFDLSAVKRLPITGRVNFEFRTEFLNAFNTPWFTPVATASATVDNYRVTAADSGRTIQLVWRVNW